MRFMKLSGLLLVMTCAANAGLSETPRLIVQITVDGLRGDLISRYMDSFGDDGFRRLIANGVWYRDAHHAHANTETIVGHATLATGAHPSEHGMIGNAWFDRVDGRLVYNIEDPDYPLLPVPGFGGEVEQLDPTQEAAVSDGRSPLNILASTFGDELFKSSNGRSKVIGISGKDRSAVAMAGHAGKAYWFSASTGAFETSAFYHDDYPAWVQEWNKARPADALVGKAWELNAPIESYLFGAQDDRHFETDLKGFGRTFPHAYGRPEHGLYYTQVLLSPYGDELTAGFAMAAITAEGLGQDAAPDLLSVSFSGVDATNHFFGPSSLESEEMVRTLDVTLAEFMAFTDETVGAERVLYVLSADHGMPEAVELMHEHGRAVERNYNEALQDELNELVVNALGVTGAIKAFFRPYIYLDHQAIGDAGVDARDVERLIVDDLNGRIGIAMAMPKVPFGEQRGDFLEKPIRRNFHPERSGDIYVAQAPYSFLMDEGPIAIMHGSPWRYDTHVPIIFAGSGIEPAQVMRSVETVDVARTLALMFGTTMPSGASGEALYEVFE
ncbi:alkaline phosphatase family protein [Shimia abyssi]|uniref:Type I phosphodiesterase/nucleotide pyrophosphatase n=1 Tax=Shimia abyssi TaxID=1662395 RepID=A0A2P8FFC3_9RHOB|nr:alkaline phosphatase family protein [Shimia abyssi]PSL20420.1 type I phosphodiesterase/nucleotide pyrophosphatase [Shimia abyssi]